MRSAKRNLLGLGKKVVGIAVEHHAPHGHNRYQFFGNKFCGIENIKAEFVALLLGKYLQSKFPLREISGFDGFP